MPATAITGAVSVTIGGMPVKGGVYGDHSWPVVLGIASPLVVWKLDSDTVDALLDGPPETTIVFTTPSGKRTEFKRIRVLREVATEDAKIRAVALADVRSYLPTGWVRKIYNLRVPSATTKLVSLNAPPIKGVPSGFQQPITLQNYLFAPSSLYGADTSTTSGVPWNADQIASDVLLAACYGHDFPPIMFEVNTSRKRTSFIPNDVYVDATGDKAIGQVLGALGGLDIRVSPAGAIQLVNAYMGAEASQLDPVVAAYSLEWKGRLRYVNMGLVCPKAGKVLVTRRVEVRGDAFTGNTQPAYGNNPVLVNQIQVTDASLPYPSAATPSVRGTYIPATSYFPAVASLADQAAPAPAISYSFMTVGMGGTPSPSFLMSTKLENMYVTPQSQSFLGPNVTWALRCRAIRAGFLRIYKLNPVFSKQCLPGSIKAERAALVDPATGTYQPATVYTDFFQEPTDRALSTTPTFAFNVNAIPGTTTNSIKVYANDSLWDSPFPLSSAQPGPFDLRIIDSTNGIMALDDQPDPSGQRKAITAPSLLAGLPTVDPSQISKAALYGYTPQAQLLTTQRVSIVFSAVPAGPNNANSLHVYQVKLSDALARLGVGPERVTARGPTVELRIRDNVAMARIPWEDGNRAALLGCFSNQGVANPALLVPVNDSELQDYATSIFSCAIASMLDRYEGTAQIEFRPDLVPEGSLSNVTHTVLADGSLYTTLFCIPPPVALDPESLMKQGSRNVLFRSLGA